jgi:uncharacterized membrane protein
MNGRRWRWYAAGLLLSLISMIAGILTNDVISSLAFLPVLVLFLGLPLVALVETKRAVPSWYVLPLAFLMGLVVTAAVLAFDLVVTSSSEHVMPVTSGIAAALNGLQLVIYRPSEPFKGNAPTKGRLDRKTAVAASIFVVLLILVAYTMVQPFPSKPLTEFYLLNEDGKTTNMPYQVSVGDRVNLTVGLANHEGRPVQYHVQVWLAEMTSASDPNSTQAMYYLDTITVMLDHMPMPLSGEWIPQHEFDYNLTVPMDGSLRLWFFLFFDDVPSKYDGLAPMTDHYSDQGQALIENARERQLLSLSIQLNARMGA